MRLLHQPEQRQHHRSGHLSGWRHLTSDWFIDRLGDYSGDVALVAEDRPTTYLQLIEAATVWRERFEAHGLEAGQAVAIDGSFSLNACSAFLAAMALGAVVVPLTPLLRARRDEYLKIAEVSLQVELDAADAFTLTTIENRVHHPLMLGLAARARPGLIIFSSGSTGAPKAILQDLGDILEKFRTVRQKKTTLAFLLFDHIGGIDTMLNTFGSGGTMVTVPERAPEVVAAAIEKHRVHTLPTSPTFLNWLLISGAWQQHDLSSLKVIAYGTEPMAQSTLTRLHAAFPGVTLVQTYGMSELGVLRSKSKGNESLWFKFTNEAFQTKVVNGTLWVKSQTAMLGYLNAPDLFDAEGWLNTQDAVEIDGEYLRVLGRATDLINVGGQKVYPAEVESALLGLEGVTDVAVFGRAHPMMGHVVAARFSLEKPEPLDAFKRRMNVFCREKLARFQIPVFVELVEKTELNARFKKQRT